MQAIESARRTLSNVEQIQALNRRVMDEQLQRLAGRWLAEPQIRKPKKGKVRRRPDELRMLRDKAIAEIADVSETITEYLKLVDERKVKPQPTWSGWPGSWREAYKIPRLRELIHKDKSRALARVRNKHKRCFKGLPTLCSLSEEKIIISKNPDFMRL
jgi:hypothetical protein